ncbi:MAG TPA: CARDB domain-containing protein, partial [Actinomycetota bacterium]|nr:CARDB domain-containing protein [Actinomycetota bacterium]
MTSIAKRWCAAALGLCLLLSGVASAAPQKADLTVARVSSASSAVQGGSLRATVKVVNRGKHRAGGSSARLFLSRDATRGRGDTKLSPAISVPGLDPGDSATKRVSVRIPAAVAESSYRLIACADATKAISESNERNNCKAAASSVTVTAPPTSHQLIDQDVASGAITEEQGLVFKVFADFGDPRLPAQYEAEPNGLEEGALEEVAERWDTLSPEAQATLRPFLIPPFYSGSYWSGQPTATREDRVTAAADTSTDLTPWCAGTVTLSTWNYLDNSTGDVRIWWEATNTNDDITAHHFVDILDNKILPALKSLMGRGPKPDGGGSCDGNSSALDIALIDANTATTYADGFCGSSGTSAHMLFPRSAASVGWAGSDPYLAHEVMHAIQYAMPVNSFRCGPSKWLREATAQWVQDYVTDPSYAIGLGPDDTEFQGARIYLGSPETSLDVESPPAFHSYGDYLLPFWAVRKSGPSIVHDMWTNAATMDPVDAVDAALPGGFQETWADFALANWNDGPVHDYKDWDGLNSGAVTVGTEQISVDNETSPSITVEHLAAKYLELNFDKDVSELEFTNDLPGDADAKVRAVVYYDNGTYDIKDLSHDAKTTLCIDDGTKRATKVILVFSNSNKSDSKVFHPTMVGKKACGCPDVAAGGTQRRSVTAAATAVCTGHGNLTFDWTDEWSNGDSVDGQTGSESGSGSLNLDLVADEGSTTSYSSTDTSTYQVSVQSQMESHSDDAPCHNWTSTSTDSGAGHLTDGV